MALSMLPLYYLHHWAQRRPSPIFLQIISVLWSGAILSAVGGVACQMLGFYNLYTDHYNTDSCGFFKAISDDKTSTLNTALGLQVHLGKIKTKAKSNDSP